MNDTVNIRMFREDIVKRLFVLDVEIDKVGSLAADELYAIDDFSRGIVEVVCDDDFVASFEEREGGKGADVARASVR